MRSALTVKVVAENFDTLCVTFRYGVTNRCTPNLFWGGAGVWDGEVPRGWGKPVMLVPRSCSSLKTYVFRIGLDVCTYSVMYT